MRWPDLRPLLLLLVVGCGTTAVDDAVVPSTRATVAVEAIVEATVPTVRSPVVPATTVAAPVATATPVWGLSDLTVAPEHPDGYERGLFEHWVDSDDDGCDTRREVLLSEAVVAPSVGEGCELSDGRWVSRYDQVVCTGSGAGCDVDHLVPLLEAWKSGAWAWDERTRRLFANDLTDSDTLVVASATSNRAKGASDPAAWLPSNHEVRCWYGAAWVRVKHTWGLTVDPAERETLAALRAACGKPGSGVP